MLIKEVCKETGLTKKAVTYYEKQGLINPIKCHNNYREYTEENVKLLKEIALYRKLDISIGDIKAIIKSSDKRKLLREIMAGKHQEAARIARQEEYLRRLCESEFRAEAIEDISTAISKEEKLNGEYIRNELARIFPGGWGKLLSLHFSPYLNEPLDTAEKLKAWENIIEFLDGLKDVKIPKMLLDFYSRMDEIDNTEVMQTVEDKLAKLLNSDEEELENYKKEITRHIEERDNINFVEMLKPLNKYKMAMREFYESSGYYEVFIPNMKILSKSYKEYSEKLIMINDKITRELGIRYDENMNIIKAE